MDFGHTILKVYSNDSHMDDIRVAYFESTDSIVAIDFAGDAVEFSVKTSIAAAKAILKHFGEDAA